MSGAPAVRGGDGVGGDDRGRGGLRRALGARALTVPVCRCKDAAEARGDVYSRSWRIRADCGSATRNDGDSTAAIQL